MKAISQEGRADQEVGRRFSPPSFRNHRGRFIPRRKSSASWSRRFTTWSRPSTMRSRPSTMRSRRLTMCSRRVITRSRRFIMCSRRVITCSRRVTMCSRPSTPLSNQTASFRKNPAFIWAIIPFFHKKPLILCNLTHFATQSRPVSRAATRNYHKPSNHLAFNHSHSAIQQF